MSERPVQGYVRTMTGDVPAASLGLTLCHEHLLTHPGAAFREGDEDLLLDDAPRAATELERFATAGGGAVVDVSCEEFGRDAAGLATLARRTGVSIVAATGHVCEAQWSGVIDIAARSDADLQGEMTRDVLRGFPEAPGVRAGVIKVGTSPSGASPDERRVLRAAAQAQRETGAAIITHCSQGQGGLEQIEILSAAGADPRRVIIGHQDLSLDRDGQLAILRHGCAIAYDSVSKERYAHDFERIALLQELLAAGYGHRICLSSDLARRSSLTAWGGGPGLTYIPWRFLPWLVHSGVSAAAASALVNANPRAILAAD